MTFTWVWKIGARLRATAVLLGLVATATLAQTPAGLNGRWAATITQEGQSIPFRLDLVAQANGLTGKLYNGPNDVETTTNASLKDGTLQLQFEHYLTSITAQIDGDKLNGKVVSIRRDTTQAVYPFHAERYIAPSSSAIANIPPIDGVWEMPHESPKGEKAWRLVVQQKGVDITATILRVDGDTGALTGSWQHGQFVASHFDGARPGLIQITPQADGSLQVALPTDAHHLTLTAYRPDVARAKGFAEPDGFFTHTSVRDTQKIFTYSYPDVHGRRISNDDPQLRGKVVLATVTGTWCPNCHDEAKYLTELYQQYHEQGLEIVALDFEEADQQASLARAKAFIQQYRIPYTFLIAGTPDEVSGKIPDAVNLNTWPAALFIGRDGRIKAIHSGFASAASGVFNTEQKAEFAAMIGKLLREPSTEVSAVQKPVTAGGGH